MGGKSFKIGTQEHLDKLADGCPLLEDLQINVCCPWDQAPNFTKFLNLKVGAATEVGNGLGNMP